MKRGAYFFVLDAFIAGIIIISSLVIVLSLLTTSEDSSQNYVLAEDFISLMETTRVIDYGGPVVYELITDGDITDTSLTLLEQAVLFHYQGRKLNATNLLKEITLLAPENSGIGYYVSEGSAPVSLYNKTDFLEPSEARTQLSAQRIVLVRGIELSPYIFEVRLWR